MLYIPSSGEINAKVSASEKRFSFPHEFLVCLFYNDFFFMLTVLQCSVNFLLYSKVTQSHIHVYILFSHIIMLHHK